MLSRMVRDKRAGFTLIEMLIVLVPIATMAVIVSPRLRGAARRGKEASLRADLKQIRDAIERFEGACAAWPPALSDIMAANGSAISADADGRGISVDRSSYDGPYLRTADGALPKDPFTGAADWTYSSTSGEVHTSSTLLALDGSAYSIW